jgi:hypothetical protein
LVDRPNVARGLRRLCSPGRRIGVDVVIRKENNSFIEVQIKARSDKVKLTSAALFAAIDHPLPRENYDFVFRSERLDATWIMSSEELIAESSQIKNGPNKGLRAIWLNGTKIDKATGERKEYAKPKYNKYLASDFSRFKAAGAIVATPPSEQRRESFRAAFMARRPKADRFPTTKSPLGRLKALGRRHTPKAAGRVPGRLGSLPSSASRISISSPVAMRMTFTALPITSARRFSPLGLVAIFNPEQLFQGVVGLKDVDGLANRKSDDGRIQFSRSETDDMGAIHNELWSSVCTSTKFLSTPPASMLHAKHTTGRRPFHPNRSTFCPQRIARRAGGRQGLSLRAPADRLSRSPSRFPARRFHEARAAVKTRERREPLNLNAGGEARG